MAILRHPQISGPFRITSRALLQPQLTRGLETETGSFEIELRGHRIQDTLETGLQIIPRSLVAPHKEGPVDCKLQCFPNDGGEGADRRMDVNDFIRGMGQLGLNLGDAEARQELLGQHSAR